MRKTLLFNDNWLFSKKAPGSFDNLMNNCDSRNIPTLSETFLKDFQSTDLPHDWLIYQTKNLYETSEGWYKKTFTYQKNTGLRTAIRFDGVYMDCRLYVNSHYAGEWKYGYSAFEFDITELIRDGENELLMIVKYDAPNSRWYSGAGIYRNVWLKEYAAEHILSDGIYVSVKSCDNSKFDHPDYELTASAEFTPGDLSSAYTGNMADTCTLYHSGTDTDITVNTLSNYKVRFVVSDKNNKIISTFYADTTESFNTPLNMPYEKNCFITKGSTIIASPEEWDINNPVCHTITAELVKITDSGECISDALSASFGFRTIHFDCNNGFFLNGRHVKINGTCEHHDLGCLGSASNICALRRQLAILKDMGVNAIRTTHNMPSEDLMVLCDELGILVNSEAFDMWELSKNPYDYSRFFKDYADIDIASWIRRDRNHPSVIMWSIGNEIYDTHADEHGLDITKRLTAAVHLSDYNRNAPVTIGSNYMPWENARKCADYVKLAGYNYTERFYDEHHKQYPDWIIYGSETASVVQSRGVYHFPLEQQILSDDDEQCSALGNSTTGWGAKSTESCIIDDRDTPFSAGQFIWTGFDYIGEPTPYQTKNSYYGQIDTAGFPKDSYYIFKAEWTDYKKTPFVHVYPYWDFNEGQEIDVRVCSNAPKVELFLNGSSLGTFDIDHTHGRKLTADYKIKYVPGELKALAYDEAGNVIASDVTSSFGDAAEVIIKPDRLTARSNSDDLFFLEINTLDKNGREVLNSCSRINITVTGEGRLLGLDNGDSADYEEYKCASRRLFNGKLLAVIGTTHTAGEIRVRATSPGLKGCEITLNTLDGAFSEGKSFNDFIPCDNPGLNISSENLIEEINNASDIPVRKIVITPLDGTEFTPECNIKRFKITALPENANAAYKAYIFRLCTVSGVDSNIAKYTVEQTDEGTIITVTALGDGDVYLRAMTKNGTDKIKLISSVKLTAKGLGEATINPYSFVSAGLFTSSVGTLGNANERGISTMEGEFSAAGFDNVDFGDYGSDEITLSCFAFNSDKYTLELWDGVPHEEGSCLLGNFIYSKEPIWTEYQSETYKLAKRIKGVKSLYIAANARIFIKGFEFKHYAKAFSKLYAQDNSKIYGDTFTLADDAVTGIGNNVSIEFENMDFGSRGFEKLIICGHSPIEKNTIHVRFASPEGEIKQLAEFTKSDGYEVREFPLEAVYGMNKVSLVFLPGCNFDLKWFRFE